MKILITGGAGYIGTVLTSMLLERGHQVRVVDDFRYEQTSLLSLCYNPNLEIMRENVNDEGIMRKAIEGVDFIFPLAAIVGAPKCAKSPFIAEMTNVGAILLLLNLKTKEQGIVYPCTNSGYGIGEEGIYCTEETPLRPISLYGQTKVEAERYVLEGGNSISLRLATVFGISPQLRLDLMVNEFVWKAFSRQTILLYEGHFKRNYIHVRDAAKAFIHCLTNFDTMKNDVYNVGLSSANLSKIELCQEIQKQIPDFHFEETKEGRDPDQRNYIVSNDKLEATGWKPDYNLQDGITELIKGYKII